MIKNKNSLLVFLILLLLTGIYIVDDILFQPKFSNLKEIITQTQTEEQENLDPSNLPTPPEQKLEVLVLKKSETFYDTMLKSGLETTDVLNAIKAAKVYLDFSQIKPGTELRLFRNNKTQEIQEIRIRQSANQYVQLTCNDNKKWLSDLISLPIEKINRIFSGQIFESLWESAEKAGLDAIVINKLVKIFAWQIDFEREVRLGDSWEIMVEEQKVAGNFLSWGDIIIAEYKNTDKVFKAIRFIRNDKGPAEYYTPEGESLRGMFIKSPIPFGRISSRFQKNRLHPILGINRPHLGVDYAAPRGTPVFAVGDGKVVIAKYSKTAGNYITIRHNSTYKTSYKHLKGFAPGIKRNKKVRQGQTIGYVGSTGLSTGPHLHFEFYENGKYIDPLGRTFPKKETLNKKDFQNFEKISKLSYAEFEKNKRF